MYKKHNVLIKKKVENYVKTKTKKLFGNTRKHLATCSYPSRKYKALIVVCAKSSINMKMVL